jgi:sulfite reductase (NADPH) flavoprotein alpha-component
MSETRPPRESNRSSCGEHITVLHGSQTGNSAWLAEQYATRLNELGFRATNVCMSRFPGSGMTEVKTLLVLISTSHNGEPPDSAAPFCQFLLGDEAPGLENVRYSVLALGDITYKDFFCTIGRELDARLAALGAERIHPRAECDVDFEPTANAWFEGVLKVLGGTSESKGRRTGIAPTEGSKATITSRAVHAAPGVSRSPTAAATAPGVAAAPSRSGSTAATAVRYSRKTPFHAEVLENRNLNGPGSDRETRHLRLSLEGSGLTFEPGDSLGICPMNDPRLVEQLIEALGYDGGELVGLDGEQCSIRDALAKCCEITVANRSLREKARQRSGTGRTEVTAGPDGDRWAAPLKGLDLLDLIRDFSLRGIGPQQLVNALRRMPPRLYSCANSTKEHPEEAHVTVSVVRYRAGGRDRAGVCSVQCAERAKPGDRLPVYVNPNPYFRLPKDPETPIIMVGPGTGCAPFRAFLQERDRVGAKGNTWLFFGARCRATDFLYADQWQSWLRRGLLTRLDVAFSRDAPQKVYVQHRMRENGSELFAWLQQGAHYYVAGDKSQMAPAVHQTLRQIVEEEGGLDRESAQQYLDDLQRDRRYQRDLY